MGSTGRDQIAWWLRTCTVSSFVNGTILMPNSGLLPWDTDKHTMPGYEMRAMGGLTTVVAIFVKTILIRVLSKMVMSSSPIW